MSKARDTTVANWLLDASGAPRAGRQLDDVDEADMEEVRPKTPMLPPSLGSPLAAGGPGAGPLPPGFGGPPGAPPALPPQAPGGAPPDLGPPPGPPPMLPGLPSAPGGPPPPMAPAPGGLPPAGLPLMGAPPTGGIGGPVLPTSPSMPPAPPQVPSHPLFPPVSPGLPPVRSAPSTIGMGGGESPAGQAPTMHIVNSVVNVGQQHVSTQASSGASGAAAPPLSVPAPPDIGPGSLGPPPTELPDTSPPPPSGGLLPTSPPPPEAPKIGPTWDTDKGQYTV